MTQKGSLENIKGLIDNWFTEKNYSGKRRQYNALLDWDEIVGPQIARNSQPEKFLNDVLVIKVRNSVWTQELTYLKPQIMEKIKASFPETKIRDLMFKVGSVKK